MKIGIMDNRGPLCMAAVLLFSLVSAVWAQGGAPLTGETIVRIRYDAPATMDIKSIRKAIRLREGDRYDPKAASRSLASLAKLGSISYESRVSTKSVPGGVEVTFKLVALKRVKKVTFQISGNPDGGESALRKLIEARTGGIHRPFIMARDARALKAHLRTSGHLFVEVGYEDKETPEGIEVIYKIAAGPRTRLETVTFEGLGDIPESDLLAAMISIRKAGWFRSAAYDPDLLRTDLIAAREVVRRKGFLDATIGHDVIFDDSRERAHLSIRVRRGAAYRISNMRIRQTELFTPEEILAVMALREGDIYSVEQIEKDILAVRNLYGRKGHVRARVDLTATAHATEPTIALMLTLDEGPLCSVRSVRIEGNVRTKDHVIRRDVFLIPGTSPNVDDIKRTERRLRNTGYFMGDSKSGVPGVEVKLQDTEEPDEVDVVVRVNEGPSADFQFGGGYSGGRGLFGNITLNFHNFDALDFPKNWRELYRGQAWTGGGQRLTLSATPGTEFQQYDIFWFNPSIDDGPYSIGFNLYWKEWDWDDYYDIRRAGASVTVKRELWWEDFVLALTPRLESIKIRDIDSGAPADAAKAKGSHTKFSLALAATYDRRDDKFLTSEGFLLNGSLEVAGGDVNYLKEEFRGRKWWTIYTQRDGHKHTVNFGGDLTFMQSMDGKVDFYERLFMGGLGSLRGFRHYRTGPTGRASKRHTGGKVRALVNGEYEAPLYKDYIRGVAFVDTGLLSEGYGESGSGIRVSTGLGVRVRLPAFGSRRRIPISVFLAVPVVDGSHDKDELFNVSVGTGFAF
jgi:outer membrane protein insertion porin family